MENDEKAMNGADRGKKKRFLSWGFTVGLLAGVVAAALSAAGLLDRLEVGTRDLRFRLRGPVEPDPEIALVTIDQRSLTELGRYPWPRGLLAQLVERIHSADPACLALDLALLEPDNPASDERLADAIGMGVTVLPVYLSPIPGQPLRWLTPAAPFSAKAHSLGHVALVPDLDGVYRTLYAYQSYGGLSYPAFSAAAATAFGGGRLEPLSASLESGVSQSDRLDITYRGPTGTFPTYSAVAVLRSDEAQLAEWFQGKLVFFGASAEGLHDAVITPFSMRAPMPAVEVHANAAATILEGDEPTVWPRWALIVLSLVLAAVTGDLFARFRPKISIVVFIGFVVGYPLAAGAVFALANHLLPVVSGLLAGSLAFLFTSLGRLVSVNRALDKRLMDLELLLSDQLSREEPVTGAAEAATSLTYTLGLHGLLLRDGTGKVLFRQGEVGNPEDEPEPPLRTYRDNSAGTELCLFYSGTPSVNEVALLTAGAQQFKRIFRPAGGEIAWPLATLTREHTQAKLDILSHLEENLAASRLTLQHVLDAAAEVILLTSVYGVVRLANTAARELFADGDGTRGPKETVGQSIYSLMPGQNLRQFLVDAVDGAISDTVKIQGMTFLLAVAPLADERGLRGFVVTLTDITELARIDRMKSDVMHILSHDLKSPLGTIRGFAELLADREVSRDERLEYVGHLAAETDKLLKLIETFLDVSRLESGRRRGQFLPVDLCAVAEEVIELGRITANQAGKTLLLDRPPAVSAVLADVNLVSRALANLLDNAVKYAPAGTDVTVAVRELERAVEVSVTDEGPGIEPEEREHIFEKFYRAKAARDVGGTGLGLSFVAQVARLHRAEVLVASTPGKGATFTLRFNKPDLEGEEPEGVGETEA
ncbi:MAG TPA: CHASE2 domain-containing protein [bacterium]|nr:CHASE2 domain-containing protein [bacterium]